MEWREQSAVSCEEAYLEAQRWIEVSKSDSKLSRRLSFYSYQQDLSIEVMGGGSGMTLLTARATIWQIRKVVFLCGFLQFQFFHMAYDGI